MRDDVADPTPPTVLQPDARQVATQLRDMIATIEPEPVPLLVPGRNRRQRRADAARHRMRA